MIQIKEVSHEQSEATRAVVADALHEALFRISDATRSSPVSGVAPILDHLVMMLTEIDPEATAQLLDGTAIAVRARRDTDASRAIRGAAITTLMQKFVLQDATPAGAA